MIWIKPCRKVLSGSFYEPYLFPKFVSFEEFLRVEMRQPLFESSSFREDSSFTNSISARILGVECHHISAASERMEIRIELPGVKLGVVEADGLLSSRLMWDSPN